MEQLLDILKLLAYHMIFIITALVFTTYLVLTIYSAVSLRRYLRKNSYVDYNTIVSSPLAPTISVIAPAYNESRTIIDNIRTLLSLYYNNYEVIVVNDGSSDDSLQKMIEAYELEKVNYYFDYQIPCKRIRGVYKSQNRSFKKLTVVDKVNGGKADSLNAGLNVSKNRLVVSIDADSIMEPDALLKMVKPFMEAKDKKVIGAGGVIRIANSCEVSGGHIKKIHLPGKFLPRAQVMEYTRAFLMGRMAWSELDGLLLISGALGMFDREVVIESGGYRTDTVGEDMELVGRIRRGVHSRSALLDGGAGYGEDSGAPAKQVDPGHHGDAHHPPPAVPEPEVRQAGTAGIPLLAGVRIPGPHHRVPGDPLVHLPCYHRETELALLAPAHRICLFLCRLALHLVGSV